MSKVQVKICCISSVEEAELAIAAGADVLGLVGHMPSGPGVIPDDKIIEIINAIPEGVRSFLLTSGMTSAKIVEQHNRMSTTSIQIVDYIALEELKKLRIELPTVELVQVIHVEDEATIDIVKEREHLVDTILLDSGKPNADVKVLGGTGKTHNWEISRQIVESSSKPVFLAGGLKPDNVEDAVNQVMPAGVDLCSGVRTDNRLDPLKLSAFMLNVKNLELS